ncbi:uncharacterized protein LOC108675102 isoform X1 [Hyalella azteca]|uniref:Uncharacterized protein LOC108675102 isoform X1 n=1 Tax=Hyalella azteca TaxID=294128 RepID=A0A8B7P0G4_HYAAZ|nr:uncharacterized protein LOC108675102 isoform X1 [Hyalella azteca]
MKNADVVLSAKELFAQDNQDLWEVWDEKPKWITAKELNQEEVEDFWHSWEETSQRPRQRSRSPPPPIRSQEDDDSEAETDESEDEASALTLPDDGCHLRGEGKFYSSIPAKEAFKEDDSWLDEFDDSKYTISKAISAKDAFKEDDSWLNSDDESESQAPHDDVPVREISKNSSWSMNDINLEGDYEEQNDLHSSSSNVVEYQEGVVNASLFMKRDSSELNQSRAISAKEAFKEDDSWLNSDDETEYSHARAIPASEAFKEDDSWLNSDDETEFSHARAIPASEAFKEDDSWLNSDEESDFQPSEAIPSKEVKQDGSCPNSVAESKFSSTAAISVKEAFKEDDSWLEMEGSESDESKGAEESEEDNSAQEEGVTEKKQDQTLGLEDEDDSGYSSVKILMHNEHSAPISLSEKENIGECSSFHNIASDGQNIDAKKKSYRSTEQDNGNRNECRIIDEVSTLSRNIFEDSVLHIDNSQGGKNVSGSNSEKSLTNTDLKLDTLEGTCGQCRAINFSLTQTRDGKGDGSDKELEKFKSFKDTEFLNQGHDQIRPTEKKERSDSDKNTDGLTVSVDENSVGDEIHTVGDISQSTMPSIVGSSLEKLGEPDRMAAMPVELFSKCIDFKFATNFTGEKEVTTDSMNSIMLSANSLFPSGSQLSIHPDNTRCNHTLTSHVLDNGFLADLAKGLSMDDIDPNPSSSFSRNCDDESSALYRMSSTTHKAQSLTLITSSENRLPILSSDCSSNVSVSNRPPNSVAFRKGGFGSFMFSEMMTKDENDHKLLERTKGSTDSESCSKVCLVLEPEVVQRVLVRVPEPCDSSLEGSDGGKSHVEACKGMLHEDDPRVNELFDEILKNFGDLCPDESREKYGIFGFEPGTHCHSSTLHEHLLIADVSSPADSSATNMNKISNAGPASKITPLVDLTDEQPGNPQNIYENTKIAEIGNQEKNEEAHQGALKFISTPQYQIAVNSEVVNGASAHSNTLETATYSIPSKQIVLRDDFDSIQRLRNASPEQKNESQLEKPDFANRFVFKLLSSMDKEAPQPSLPEAHVPSLSSEFGNEVTGDERERTEQDSRDGVNFLNRAHSAHEPMKTDVEKFPLTNMNNVDSCEEKYQRALQETKEKDKYVSDKTSLNTGLDSIPSQMVEQKEIEHHDYESTSTLLQGLSIEDEIPRVCDPVQSFKLEHYHVETAVDFPLLEQPQEAKLNNEVQTSNESHDSFLTSFVSFCVIVLFLTSYFIFKWFS